MSAAIQSFINNPAYYDALSLLKGARNGLVYGAKIRFPHALVIAILFGRGECVDPLSQYQLDLADLLQLEVAGTDYLPPDQSARHESHEICHTIQNYDACTEEDQPRQRAALGHISRRSNRRIRRVRRQEPCE